MAVTEQERRRRQARGYTFFFVIAYVLGAWFSAHWGAVLDECSGIAFYELDGMLLQALHHANQHPLWIPQVGTVSFRFFYVYSLCCVMSYLFYLTSRKKWRKGQEYGSARWASKKEGKQLRDSVYQNNILLTQTERLSLDTRKTRKNLNVAVIGDSGSGKSRSYVLPNLMQMHSSYVISDLKGELLASTGRMLRDQGNYSIRVLNLIDMSHSHCYSPFAYLQNDDDVMRLVKCIIVNTTPPDSQSSDPFWERAEEALLQALCFFIWKKLPVEEQNFSMVMRLLRMAEIDEENSNNKSELDFLFDELQEENPEHIAVLQYAIFKQAAGKTAKSILISTSVRLAIFNEESVARLTQKDTLHLEELYQTDHAALFLLLPAGDTTFHFIASLLYTQLFQLLMRTAFQSQEKRLPNHVRFLLDEFANIGVIPDFAEIISVMRSMEFSVSIILQNLEQLEKNYKTSYKTILGNCNSKLFLGGEEQGTTKMISEMLDKETIDMRTHSATIGRQRSVSRNDQRLGRELLTPGEVARIPDEDCILLIRGNHPFYSKKYDLQTHPRYEQLYDGKDKEKHFDVKEIVTPKRDREALQEALEKKPSMVSLKNIHIGISEINKMRYALEYEL